MDSLLAHPAVLAAGGLAAAVWLYGVIQERRANPNRLPLPPGPKGYPIIGNLFGLPHEKAWLGYADWIKTYGDMIYFEVLGQPFLVLGSPKRTNDLFEKRSSNYSDRSRLPMLMEIANMSYNMAFMPYGDWWRRHRRSFHSQFQEKAVQKWKPAQLITTRAFLRRLLKDPDDFMNHIRHVFAATIMRCTYGIIVKDEHDPFVEAVEEALTGLAESGHYGSFLVDLFPIMRYIPEWFPGATWKKKGNRWRHNNHVVEMRPFELVKEQMKAGTAPVSIARSLIENLPNEDDPRREEEEAIARDTCAVAFIAGADTTVSAVQTFFLAMALYPDVQKKAQAELDQVIGGRLPEFNDRPQLPYIMAIMKESLRWQLVTPLAAGHMCTNGDEYDGYYIPKGTIVLGNGWAILHDPEAYQNPLEFNPERYLKDGELNPDVRDPTAAAFGYGRRVCPGRYFSDDALFAIITHVLAVYDLRPGLDENGNEVEIVPDVTDGILSYPKPFKCRITPRTKQAEALIRNTEVLDV